MMISRFINMTNTVAEWFIKGFANCFVEECCGCVYKEENKEGKYNIKHFQKMKYEDNDEY